MKARSIFVVTLIAATLAPPALAQQSSAASGAAKTTTKTAGPAAAKVQPELAPLVAPRAAELTAAGIQKITARTGKRKRDIQVTSRYGPFYFAWPKNVTPVTFDIVIGQGNAVTVQAAGYNEANKANYAAAFDAIIPEALRLVTEAKTRAERPRH